MIFQSLVSHIRKGRVQHAVEKAHANERSEELRLAIEHVVDEVNPKIRALGGYRKKLKPAVERSLDHCSDIVAMIPGPVEVNSKVWSGDPMLRALFSGVEDMRRVFSRSKDVHDFFARNTRQQHCYALLSMLCRERSILGMEMQGEVLKRDVPQTSVSFSDHRVVKPAWSEPKLRDELQQRAFDVLVSHVMECIADLLVSRNSLEEQRRLLEMQLRVARVKGASLSPLLQDGDSKVIDIEALRKQQERTGRELEQARVRLTTLGDYVERIIDVLAVPEQHMKAGSKSMSLSKMNIKLEGKSRDAGHDLEFTEVSLGELRRILLMVKIPRQELLSREDMLKAAERSLY